MVNIEIVTNAGVKYANAPLFFFFLATSIFTPHSDQYRRLEDFLAFMLNIIPFQQ